MKYGEFMAQLAKAGEEEYYIKRAEERLLGLLLPEGGDESARQVFFETADIEEIIGALATMPFFSPVNIVEVKNFALFKNAKKDEDEKKSKPDKNVERLAAVFAEMPPSNYAVFTFKGKVDKRKKIYKIFEKYGAVLESERVRPWETDEFLHDKLRSLNKEFARDALVWFKDAISLVDPVPLAFLDNELNKVALFAKERKITKEELTISFSALPEMSNFALADAILQKNATDALRVLSRAEKDGTYMPLVLSVVARQTRQLLRFKLYAQKGVQQRELAQLTGLPPFIAEKNLRAAKRYSLEELQEAMLALADADWRMKTGNGGNEILFGAVIKLCGG